MDRELYKNISEKMSDAKYLLETAKDACSANNFCQIECVLNYSLSLIQDVYDEIELIQKRYL